jgi:hypothetical protein
LAAGLAGDLAGGLAGDLAGDFGAGLGFPLATGVTFGLWLAPGLPFAALGLALGFGGEDFLAGGDLRRTFAMMTPVADAGHET